MVDLATDVELATLSSGTRVAVTRLPTVHTTTLFAELSVGSRFEAPRDNGLSHFLEHMLFRGTERHPTAQALALAFDELGASVEASTSADTGTLSATMPPESFDAVLPLFSEMLQAPVFDAIETERGIVREEILEELDERGRMIDAETLLLSLVYEGHPLAQPVIGTLDHLGRFDRDALRRHHDQHYTGASTVITVAGPVAPERTLGAVEATLGALPSGGTRAVEAPAPQTAPRFRHVRHPDSQTALRVGFVGPGARDADEPAVQLLLRLLDDGMSTRLYRRICDELGLCYDVSADYAAFQDTGLLAIAADSAHGHAAEVLGEILGVVRTLRDDGPSEEELERAKRRYAWSLRELLDDPQGMAEYQAVDLWLGRGERLADRLAAIHAVDTATLRRVAESLFDASRLSVASVGTAPRRELERLALDFR